MCTVIQQVSVISGSTIDSFFLLKPVTLLDFSTWTKNWCNKSPFFLVIYFQEVCHAKPLNVHSAFKCFSAHISWVLSLSGRNDLKADFRRIFKLRSCFKTLQKVSCVWIGINSVMVFGSNFWSTIYRLLAGTVCVKEGLESTQRRLWLKRRGSMNMLSECFGMFFFFYGHVKITALWLLNDNPKIISHESSFCC